MKITLNIQLTVLFLYHFVEISREKLLEDGRLNFTALATKYGYPVEEHEVITEDGYILNLFQIKGERKFPVLLMHGMIASADVFIIRGKSSLALTLAKNGYDVWAGNIRGSPYSRRHVTLDPDIDKRFWNFSFHEMGYHDLPAIIDYILNHNGVEKLNAIGHSQGNTIFYVLGSTRPDYNGKINVFAALAPVYYMDNLQTPWPFVLLAGPTMNELLKALKSEELFDDPLRIFIQNWCTDSQLRINLCLETFFELAGRDPEGFEKEFLRVAIGHFPTSTSRKNALHVFQIASTTNVSQFDYGSRGNLLQYGTRYPSQYDLNKVTMPIYLYAGLNDRLSSIKDVNTLANKLPNVREYVTIKWDKFNHIDHVWGKNMKKYLFPHLLNVLSRYS